MQTKLHGFSYVSSNLTTLPLIIMDSYFLDQRTHEYFFPNTLQLLSLSDSSDMTLDIFMQILVMKMEPFVHLLGPGPGLELISQINPCTTCPFGKNSECGLRSHLK